MGLILAVLGVCGCSALQPFLARRHQGHLTSADHPGLHACFYRKVGVVAGLEFEVVRVTRIGPRQPRFTPFRSTTVGRVRIRRVESERCAEVEVLEGSPRVDDRLYRAASEAS
jgi:hypothetical protein